MNKKGEKIYWCPPCLCLYCIVNALNIGGHFGVGQVNIFAVTEKEH